MERFYFLSFFRIMTVVHGSVFTVHVSHTCTHVARTSVHQLMNMSGDFLNAYAEQFTNFVESIDSAFIRTSFRTKYLSTFQFFRFKWSHCVVCLVFIRLSVLCQRCETSDWSFAHRHGTSSVRFLISFTVCATRKRNKVQKNSAKVKLWFFDWF